MSISALTISLFVVDRIPRNIILSGGMIAVSIPLAGEAAMTSLFLGTTNKSGLAAGVAFLYIYIFLYGLFLDGPGYFYVSSSLMLRCFRTSADRFLKASEIFPSHLRAKGATCCVACYALINIMWTQVSPIAFAAIGWKYYMVFICCCVVAAVVMFFFPNTLNKPLEEVAMLFGDGDLVAHYVRNHEAGVEVEKSMYSSVQVEA